MIYSLAEEDVARHALFASRGGFEPTTAPGTEPKLAQLRAQLADKEQRIAALEGTLAANEEIIILLRANDTRPTWSSGYICLFTPRIQVKQLCPPCY